MRKISFVLLAAVVIAALGAAAVKIMPNRSPPSLAEAAQAAPAAPAADAGGNATLSPAGIKLLAITKDDRILGKADAPVTIVEYASLSCPHCADFEAHTLPKIEKTWIDTGKAKLILRDFPLDEPAVEAAMIARCAPADRFYAYVNALFGSQADWVFASDRHAALGRIAKLGGMDGKEVARCFADKALQEQILKSRLDAAKDLKIEATPTFFINGTKLTGEPKSLQEFEDLLRNAAAKSAKG
jgi:protein-disulfide isomerase